MQTLTPAVPSRNICMILTTLFQEIYPDKTTSSTQTSMLLLLMMLLMVLLRAGDATADAASELL